MQKSLLKSLGVFHRKTIASPGKSHSGLPKTLLKTKEEEP